MKSKRIILVSHCVLNQNAVLEGWARAKGAFPVAGRLLEAGVGIIQLPCPELLFSGINRPPKTYEEYNTPVYRKLCKELALPYIRQIKEYLENGYTLLGVLGIYNSPTCSISGKMGVFMEALFALCNQENITLKYVEIPKEYSENATDQALENKIEKLLGE